MPYLGRMTTATRNDAGQVPQWSVQDRLRKAREHAGLTQLELAESIGVARNSVSNYESGATKPRQIVLNQWSLATGVPLSWLQLGDDNDGCAMSDSNTQPADLESPPTLLDAHYTNGWFVTEWPTIPIAA